MLLAIDCGNTRTKWAVFNTAGDICFQGACLNKTLNSVDFHPTALHYNRVAISNVAGEEIKTLLINKLAQYKLSILWLKSTSQICGVLNRYSKPETLGTDRWAALIAAWHIKHAPCVVVNAGTAITIDALSVQPHTSGQAEFIGGYILPGLNLIQQSLGQATAQLPVLTSLQLETTAAMHLKDIFPKNTADAIATGALQAACGAITLMSSQLYLECKQIPQIIISGGNAQAIKNGLMSDVTNHALIVDNLVLHGLYLLENAMSKEIMQGDAQ